MSRVPSSATVPPWPPAGVVSPPIYSPIREFSSRPRPSRSSATVRWPQSVGLRSSPTAVRGSTPVIEVAVGWFDESTSGPTIRWWSTSRRAGPQRRGSLRGVVTALAGWPAPPDGWQRSRGQIGGQATRRPTGSGRSSPIGLGPASRAGIAMAHPHRSTRGRSHSGSRQRPLRAPIRTRGLLRRCRRSREPPCPRSPDIDPPNDLRPGVRWL